MKSLQTQFNLNSANLTPDADAIPITLHRNKRRTRGLSIRVHHNGQVEVRAPLHAPDKEIMDILNLRRDWIKQKLATFKLSHPVQEQLQYRSGEIHHFLGKALKLRIYIIEKNRTSIIFSNDDIEVNIQDDSAEKVKAALNKAYREQAKSHFSTRMESLIGNMPWVRDCPPLKVRAMKHRWGSCSHDGRINLNTHLIKAPVDCIDSVIVHELCHIKEHNHSHRFYALMTEIMPEWRQHKVTLEKLGHNLLTD